MQETEKKGRTATYLLFGIGLVVIATAGIVLYPGFVESRLIRTVASPRSDRTKRFAAARRLADLGSIRAIPGLIRAAAGFLDQEDGGQSDLITSYQAQILSLLRSRDQLVQARDAALKTEAEENGTLDGGTAGGIRAGRRSAFMLNQIKAIDTRLERILDTIDRVFAGDPFFESLQTIVSAAGREALPSLLSELDRENAWQRQFVAIRLLGEAGAEAVRAVATLKAALDLEHPLLRYAARRALAGIEASSVEPEDSAR